MEGGPWAYDNHPLIYERVKEGEVPDIVELETLVLWIQTHALLVGFMLKLAARSFGDKLGRFIESDPNNFVGPWRMYIRLRVQIDVRRALKKTLKVKQPGGEWKEVDIKSDRLPTFCFRCGMLGHGERFYYKNYEEVS